MSQEIKLLKEKIDLLIRRLFGSKSEIRIDSAQEYRLSGSENS
jgi:hypothetical protein